MKLFYKTLFITLLMNIITVSNVKPYNVINSNPFSTLNFQLSIISYDAYGNPTSIVILNNGNNNGNNGNGNNNGNNNRTRRMVWDEENRLLALSDQGRSFQYMYDAGGERVLKGNGGGIIVDVNGYEPAFTGNYIMYVNPYIVVNGSNQKYTKHFFIEGQRIASKIGDRDIQTEINTPKAGSVINVILNFEEKSQKAEEALRYEPVVKFAVGWIKNDYFFCF